MSILVYILIGFVLGAFTALRTFPQNNTVINSPDIKIKNSDGATASEIVNLSGEQKPGKKKFFLFRLFKKKTT